jgi:hypothetical protein
MRSETRLRLKSDELSLAQPSGVRAAPDEGATSEQLQEGQQELQGKLERCDLEAKHPHKLRRRMLTGRQTTLMGRDLNFVAAICMVHVLGMAVSGTRGMCCCAPLLHECTRSAAAPQS